MTKTRDVDPSEGIEQYIGRTVQDARLALRKAKFEGHEWTQSYLATRVFVAQSRISEVETGDVPPDTELARNLEKALGVRSGTIENLVRILNRESVRDYAKPYVRRLPEAQMIHDFGLIVPGLLQTKGYASALVLAGQAGDPKDMKRFVDQRMERAKRLWEGENPPWMTAIIYEAVLRSDMGNPDAACEQLQHLLKAQEQPNISVRVLPFGAAIVSGSFTLLTLSNGRRATYTEGFSTGSYSDETAEVMRFQKVYDRLAEDAESAQRSSGLIHEALKRFK
ncbi:helix-turn-helix domain-containing protein [Streptomyces tubercidicus]|uniref:helix-turn-helix domain-containing protein n=1 Tax=Streptomyces tubercidicus TaxID=47759 RepID=UPI0036BDE8D7